MEWLAKYDMTDSMRLEVRNIIIVSVMVGETTDVCNTAQTSYVLCYTTDSGVKERFSGLVMSVVISVQRP